jgi:hypothetical protein
MEKHSTFNIQHPTSNNASGPQLPSMLAVGCSALDVSKKIHPSLSIPLPSEGRGKQPVADLAVIDCSFISLKKILPPAIALLKTDGKIVALVKPQFEAGKAEVDKGRGVISDPAIHERVLNELEQFVNGLGGAGSPLPADGAHGVTRPTISFDFSFLPNFMGIFSV